MAKQDWMDELEEGLRIDQHALDEACMVQPQAFYNVAKELAMAVSRRDAAKQILNETEARADARIRHDIEVSGEKVTETAVKNRIALDKAVLAAQRDVHVSNEHLGRLTALKEAFSQRGYVLRDLVQLHMSQHYGDTEYQGSRVRDARARSTREQLNERRRAG